MRPLRRGHDTDEVVAKFKAGATKQSLLHEYEFARHTLDRILITAGAMTYDHPRSGEILKLHERGMGRMSIARELGINHIVVAKIIRAQK